MCFSANRGKIPVGRISAKIQLSSTAPISKDEIRTKLEIRLEVPVVSKGPNLWATSKIYKWIQPNGISMFSVFAIFHGPKRAYTRSNALPKKIDSSDDFHKKAPWEDQYDMHVPWKFSNKEKNHMGADNFQNQSFKIDADLFFRKIF